MCSVPVPFIKLILISKFMNIHRRGVVGRVPAFQPGGPGSIPGGVTNYNFCPFWIFQTTNILYILNIVNFHL